MPTATSPTQPLKMPSQVRRVRGQAGDLYELIFLDRQDRIIVPLTEWYRLRKEQGPTSTRRTYLACLQSYFAFLAETECPWNAPPERLRQTLIAFHRDHLKCQVRPQRDTDTVEITITRETPLRESTLKVMHAALRDFYLVMKGAGLYAFANPLSSEVLVTLKREQERALANKGAPDQAGIREETHEQARRDGGRADLSAERLATHMSKVVSHEESLRQRLRDLDQKKVLSIIAGQSGHVQTLGGVPPAPLGPPEAVRAAGKLAALSMPVDVSRLKRLGDYS